MALLLLPMRPSTPVMNPPWLLHAPAACSPMQPHATPCATLHQVLFTREQIADKTVELGQRVSHDYADKRPVIMPILKVGGCGRGER